MTLFLALQSLQAKPSNLATQSISSWSNNNAPLSSKQTHSEKQQSWQSMEKEVGSWVDRLGKPIDPGIKDTIIVLNLLGFKTMASCEGHDWGLSHPWIDFETKNQEVISLQTKLNDILEQIEKKKSEIQKQYPDLSRIDAVNKALSKKQAEDLNSLLK